MLRNIVLETTNAPGNSATVNLAGAATGRVAFSQVFSNGAVCFYFMTDGSQAEWGTATFTSGVPNQLTSRTPISNTSGTTSRLNFTSSSVYVYNDVPAERTIYADINLLTTLPGDATLNSIGGGQIAGNRNAIINGAMDVWQRGTSFSSPVSGTYTADRWVHNFDGTGATFVISRTATATQTLQDAGIRYNLNYNCTVAGSGGTVRYLIQKIEGVRTFAGRTVTVSAYLNADAARTVQVMLGQNFGTGGSPSSTVFSSTTSWSVTTTGTKFTATFTLPTINGKTLGSNGDDALWLYFLLPVNTVCAVNISGVQVEPGVVATPFEWRPTATELALCQRYFQTGQVYSNGQGTAGVTVLAGQGYAVTPRAAPTVTVTTNASANLGSITASGNISLVTASAVVTATAAYSLNVVYNASSEL